VTNLEPSLKDLDAIGLAARIYEVGMLAQRSGDLDDLLYSILERILQEVEASYAGIALLSRDGQEMVHALGLVRDGEVIGPGYRQPVGKGVVGKVAQSHEAMVLDDVTRFEDYVPLVDGIHSEMAIPLAIGERLIAVLDVESEEVARFGANEQALLQAVATPVAQAIEIARLSEEDRRRMEQLAVLNRVSRAIGSATDLDEVLNRAAETIRAEFGYFMVALGLAEEDGASVLLAASSAEPIDLPLGHRQPAGEGIVGQVGKTHKSILVQDTEASEDYLPAHPGVRCEMCCPLLSGGRLIGFLDAEALEPYAFGEADLLVFQTLAEHLAEAVAGALHLRQVNQLREDLANMVVHDMRNPLTVMQSALEMLEYGDQIDRERYLGNAQQACDDLLLLIDGFLELQRLESGTMQLDRTVAHPELLLRRLQGQLETLARQRDLTIEVRAARDLAPCRCDHGLLLRVLHNLAFNSVKYTPDGGRIELSVGPAPDQLRAARLPAAAAAAALLFEVRDDGPGIAEEHRARVFDKFVTLGDRHGDRTHGTGLGLAFCREAVRAHGGRIWVESEPGEGSRFRFLLPLDG